MECNGIVCLCVSVAHSLTKMNHYRKISHYDWFECLEWAMNVNTNIPLGLIIIDDDGANAGHAGKDNIINIHKIFVNKFGSV